MSKLFVISLNILNFFLIYALIDENQHSKILNGDYTIYLCIYLYFLLALSLNIIAFLGKDIDRIITYSKFHDFFNILYILLFILYRTDFVFFFFVPILSVLLRKIFRYNELSIVLLLIYECFIIGVFIKTLDFQYPFFIFLKLFIVIFHPFSMYFNLYIMRGFSLVINQNYKSLNLSSYI